MTGYRAGGDEQQWKGTYYLCVTWLREFLYPVTIRNQDILVWWLLHKGSWTLKSFGEEVRSPEGQRGTDAGKPSLSPMASPECKLHLEFLPRDAPTAVLLKDEAWGQEKGDLGSSGPDSQSQK